MSDAPNRKSCPKCRGPMQGGYADAVGFVMALPYHVQSQVVFVVPGEPTKANPIAAFKQGLEDAPDNLKFTLRGLRCANCGFVEFYATESVK